MTFYATNNIANYTIGGARLWFNPLVTAPSTYGSWAYLGNVIVRASMKLEEIARYDAIAGRASPHPSIALVDLELGITFDEPNEDNLLLLFMGDTPSSHVFNPGVLPMRQGKTTLRFVSHTGNEIEWKITKGILRPSDQDFAVTSEDWANGALSLSIQPNTGSSPYGTIQHFGVGTNLAAAAAPSW